MCTSPLCPNECRAVARNALTRQQHMSRTWIRVYDAQRRQHYVPVGWWCPSCHAFRDDLR
ncbi:MAG TPA: hypothetical protein VMW77_07675 [Methanoregula sp.]|nr:hypothetical protein [Methanoregula sp.]